jgi:hypothetical protein
MDPLAELQQFASQANTGEFICVAAETEIHVYLQRGRIAWATSSTHPFEFARYIKEHNAIDDATFRHVIEECRRNQLPLGETLVAWELLTWNDVQAALCHQVRLALSTLAQLSGARTMFLERKRYIEYNSELTIELDAVLPRVVSPSRAPPGGTRVSTQPPAAPHVARQLLEEIEGAAWVELLDGGRLLDAAPSVNGSPRVPSALVEATLDDDADFVAIRSARGSILGARLARARRSLWCTLSADSTFGAAVSTLCSLSIVQPHESTPPRSSAGRTWETGDASSLAAAEIRLVLGRAQEVLAAWILSPTGEPVVGVAREGVDDRCLELLRRRAGVFAVSTFESPANPSPRSDPAGLAALGFTFRTLVTGERSYWCFGAELLDKDGQTLWVLTDRNASQGFGWACLTALCRGVMRPAEQRGAP